MINLYIKCTYDELDLLENENFFVAIKNRVFNISFLMEILIGDWIFRYGSASCS